jgi:hypothetical protein
MKTSPNLIYASIDYAKSLSIKEPNLLKCYESKIIYEGFAGYDRFNNNNPFSLITFNKFLPPLQSSVTPISFSDATDSTAIMLGEHLKTNDLPLVVHWSGGIDSTVILAALVKNFNKEQLSRVIVSMNNASYFENPCFFDQIIQPNFKYLDSSKLVYNWDNSIIINGDPADKLWIHANIVEIELEHKNVFDRSLSNPNILINWLARRSDDAYAKWLFNYVLETSNAAGISLENYSDFYWWINYGLFYTGCAFTSFVRSYNGSITEWENYNKNFFVWYNTPEYQKWSIYAQSTMEKFKGTITDYKMPAKEYIFEVDKNAWYKKYKTKSGSSKFNQHTIVDAIFEDGTVIYKDPQK